MQREKEEAKVGTNHLIYSAGATFTLAANEVINMIIAKTNAR